MDVFAQFDLQKIALLLDVDGTIVDIGPSPNEVHVGGAAENSSACLLSWMERSLS
jgi:hypothetical protein